MLRTLSSKSKIKLLFSPSLGIPLNEIIGFFTIEPTPLIIIEKARHLIYVQESDHALYLLENAGVKVRYEGSGTVRKQSIPAGTPLTPKSTIRIELS